MNLRNFSISTAILISFSGIDASVINPPSLHSDRKISFDNLHENFINPPDSCRTKLWWFHGETETTRDGIDADLEAFSKQGIGGVVFYDQVHGSGEGAAESMSPQWWDALKYAAVKARQLGLTFEVAAGNGYIAGGPWITPRLAMKKTEVSDTTVYSNGGDIMIELPHKDNAFVDVATVAFPADGVRSRIRWHEGRINVTSPDTIIAMELPSPATVRGISYTIMPRGKGSTGSMNIPCLPSERYCGAKYVEYPPVGQLEYSDDGNIWKTATPLLPVESNIGHKSRVRSISFPAVTAKFFRLNIHDWNGNDTTYKSTWLENVALFTHDIVDNLETKSGLRTEVTYPAPTGLSVGSIDKESILDLSGKIGDDGCLRACLPEGYWTIVRLGYRPTGARTKHGRKNLLGLEADVMSAEAATVHFNNYFRPVCDTLASIGAKPSGMCMDSHEAGIQNWTSGFEKVLEERLGEDFYLWVPAFAGFLVDDRAATDRFFLDFRSAVAEAIADNFYATFARLCNERGVLFTSQAMLNIDNDNLASRGKADRPQGEFWAYQTDGNFDVLDAASAAHIYGHNIASGEAFTDTPYSESYDDLLRIANLAYCRGINEFVVCASTYQPWPDRQFDDSSSAHPYVFHRFHPEWNSSRPFWNYQARCAYMLRQGAPVVDIAVYAGEELPVKTFAFRLPKIPEGYNFDLVNYDALANRMEVDSVGNLCLAGGMKYRVLIVGKGALLSERSERELARLSSAGLKLIRCDKGEDVADCLKNFEITPDINFNSANLPDDRVCFFHRDLGDIQIFFVYNHSENTYSGDLTPSGVHECMEIWDPYNLSRKSLSNEDFRKFEILPHKSIFIVMAD